ncbi:uncharacterized protein TRAVEDRAFT_134433, partial [Trametes versicolor FP-101664 SS1]|uniref:uncharacterized protein n=1 Tax=Trametes versicolor (strain FP-101664) TaxID=717944 RepID=UPI0004623C20
RSRLIEPDDTALLVWHYLLTFEKEITFFWRRKFSGASALFLTNRYLSLAVVIYNLLSRELYTPSESVG